MDTKRVGSSIIVGVGVIYVIAAICSLLFSLLLTFTSLQEAQVSLIITIISFVALFIGGFVAGGRGKEKGWLLGGLTGIIYTVINFLYQYLGHDMFLSSEQLIYHVCFIIIAIMGGILGVNLFGNHRNQAS